MIAEAQALLDKQLKDHKIKAIALKLSEIKEIEKKIAKANKDISDIEALTEVPDNSISKVNDFYSNYSNLVFTSAPCLA